MISKKQVKFLKQLEQKKYRKREGLFVAEGPKVVGDLLDCGFNVHTIYATENWKVASQGRRELITEEELRRLSFLQNPQDVIGLFEIPDAAAAPTAGLTLALDGIQDPGNLGTIIRIADWFGIATICCSPDTVDAWNPKVVQATMGSIARVNIIYTDLSKYIGNSDLPVYGTLLDGQDIYSQPLSQDGIIVMGNEGNGISPEIRKLVTHKLFIPCFHQGATHAESLNVAIATAITCSEFKRRK